MNPPIVSRFTRRCAASHHRSRAHRWNRSGLHDQASWSGTTDCVFSAPEQSCVVSGLTNGIEYQFTAAATNWLGDSGDSAPSTALAPSADTFTSTWDTTKTSTGSSNSTTVKLPLVDGGDYNFSVSWGDGPAVQVTSATDPDATHVYTTRGTKNVSITGRIDGWRFNGSGDRLKLTDISTWGPLTLGNSGGYFKGAANFNASATDIPDLDSTTNFSEAFSGASAFNGDISNWTVTSATNMSGIFKDASAFNRDLSNWNVSNVTNMSEAFAGSGFTNDLTNWTPVAANQHVVDVCQVVLQPEHLRLEHGQRDQHVVDVRWQCRLQPANRSLEHGFGHQHVVDV